MKRAEDEERRRGEAEGKELLFSWRNERDDVERWLKKEEHKLQQEPDDLDLIGNQGERPQYCGITREWLSNRTSE